MKRRLACSALLGLWLLPSFAAETPPPVLQSVTRSNNSKTVTFTPSPAAQAYTVRSGTSLNAPLTNDPTAVLRGNRFTVSNTAPSQFFSLEALPMSSNALLTANLLNRIAYGPTPDELERLASIGPQAYIDEQLAPENISYNIDTYTSVRTNSGSTPPQPGWQQVVVDGTFSANTIYFYLTRAGEAHVDAIQLQLWYTEFTTNVVNGTNVVTTNTYLGTNLVVNGDFENVTYAPWTPAANVAGSMVTSTTSYSGNQSLHVISTTPGTTGTSGFQQTFYSPRAPSNSSQNRCRLSFWYRAATNSSALQVRLSGSGATGTASDQAVEPQWIYVTATGRATTTPALYIYLNGAGTAYLDDLKLVAGSVPEAGVNLIQNGSFEGSIAPWQRSADFTNSDISTVYAKAGASSLKLVATAAGAGSGDSVFQSPISGLANGQTYTVSFWYLPAGGRQLIVRLSGSQLVAGPDASLAGVRRRLDSIGNPDPFTGMPSTTAYAGAGLADLRAWFTQNAVGSRRQLLEVLLQFLENHFVTQNAKSREYLDQFYDNGTLEDAITTEWEYREISRWRDALLNPNCNFYDLLEISAESPAMIVYLDTVNSRGNGNNVANENYARELFELFCMGVDNGYDQNDIVVMSRAWTGWTVDIVDPWNIDNPFAARTLRNGLYPGVGSNSRSNLVGIWSFIYNSGNHGTNRAPILSVWDPNGPPTSPRALGPKIVPARFGTPWAGQTYQLVLPQNRTGTNGIRDGYDVIRHLADLPFTMEYLSVKLCRLFVHDDFEHGVYDYTDPNRSAEAELIRQCMLAWHTPAADGRRGNIRSVLTTIFNSDLFRSHGGSLQKVKTPLEFVVSAVRTLRAQNANGTWTADTDGYSFHNAINRMGGMSLFNRADPDGYPESGPPWISAGTLDERVLFVQAYLRAGTGDDAGNCVSDPVALLKLKLPSGQWNDAGAVADFFLGLIYPGEGRGNLTGYRQMAVDYLNTADNGTASAFQFVSNTSTTYDTRVRGMVAMLMTQQRFQEQ